MTRGALEQRSNVCRALEGIRSDANCNGTARKCWERDCIGLALRCEVMEEQCIAGELNRRATQSSGEEEHCVARKRRGI